MLEVGIPVRNRAVQVLGVDVPDWPEVQIPLVRVVGFEVEMRVLVLVRLLHHGVFEVVALPKRAEAMVVVIHPLVHG